MNLNFLDNGLPIESGKEKIAAESMKSFREYCVKLGKKTSELTKDELLAFYEIQQ